MCRIAALYRYWAIILPTFGGLGPGGAPASQILRTLTGTLRTLKETLKGTLRTLKETLKGSSQAALRTIRFLTQLGFDERSKEFTEP